jgi:hypothetical protein
MGNTVGTIRKIVLDGVTYDVPVDAKGTMKLSRFETEAQATTGDALFKMTRRNPAVEGLEISTTPSQMESLKAKAESLADVTMSLELADASVYKAVGRVNYDSYETETGKSKVTLMPKRDWTAFLAD